MFTFYCHPIFHYPLPLPYCHPSVANSMHSSCCFQVWHPSQSSSQPICHKHHVAHYQGKLCPKHAHLANSYASRSLSSPRQHLNSQVTQATDQLEHFMEDAESFFAQLDRFPELQETAKQLIKQASLLRKQEPCLDKESVAAYQIAVKNLEQESRAKLMRLREQLMTHKKAMQGQAASSKTEEVFGTADVVSEALRTMPPLNVLQPNSICDESVHNLKGSHNVPGWTQRQKAKEEIERAEKKLVEAFDALTQRSSYSYADLLASRQAFWLQHKNNLHMEDLEGFQKKTEGYQAVDEDLILFTTRHSECKNHLDLMDAWKSDATSLKHPQQVLGVLKNAEKYAAMRLIKELHKAALFFKEHGYQTVAEHYYTVLEEFLDLVDHCTNFEKGMSEYLQEWEKRENEMTANQEHFEVLHETQVGLSEFEKVPHNKEVEIQLKALNDRKANLKDSYDIERFIQDAQRLIQ